MWQSKCGAWGPFGWLLFLLPRDSASTAVLHKMSKRETGLFVLPFPWFPCQLGFGEFVSDTAACDLKLRVVGVHLYMK
jgi:hypothetical protein